MHIRRPVAPMLAAAVEDIPRGADLVYEPKWDGFRAQAIVTDEGQVNLYSRNLTRLTGTFPETVQAIAAAVPRGTVLDGELVRWGRDGRLDFAALQHRLGVSSVRAFALARAEPVHFVAFDVLEARPHGDLRNRPLRERRAVLEEMLRDAPGPGLLVLCPQESGEGTARLWLELLPAQGIEGLVIKPAGSLYRSGVRGWYKLRRRFETLAIIGGVTGTPARPQGLILGRYPSTGGTLRVVGRTPQPPPGIAAELADVLTPAGDDHPWPAELPPGWTGGLPKATPPTRYQRVRPEVVVEIAVDTATDRDRRWRHLARVHAVRTDLGPPDVPTDLDLTEPPPTGS
jgi:ATP-dependent DNA ligase